MSEFLVIRIGNTPDEPANWIAVESTGSRRSPPVTGPLAEAVNDIGDRKVIVLVNSADVLTTSVDIPIKGGARLQAALPYALEEYVAEDVDNLHFAAGTRRSSGKTPVSVVNRETLEGWIARLDAAGIDPTSIMAESYGLARIPGTISMLVAEDQVVVNNGADVELVLQNVSPGDALAAIGALDPGTGGKEATGAAGEMPRHVLVYCAAGEEERFAHDWIAIRQELDSLDVKVLADGILPRLAVTVVTGAGVNLLQGEFGKRTEYAGLLRPWKYAAVLLLAFLVVSLAAKGTDIYRLKKQEASLMTEFHDQYRQVSPGAADVLDPAAVVKSLRARIAGGASGATPVFLQSMEQLSRALQQNQSVRLEAISYRPGIIDVRLSAPDVATLDNVQRTIAENGRFTAAIQSTDQDGDKVNSRIQIQANGA
ncbi:MAG: type II secretion system protein GspL [Gammaproteobacteria bacterium]|nr:type II secretion system protein GspL [Gammaproteobacteria bacterium]MDH4314764.1 type II secretion system protein GspL [Gammaproteobacteria bacterium]MDH5214666.1 type II secretion system protein GspL [Gammaproteobacteria bacterium]